MSCALLWAFPLALIAAPGPSGDEARLSPQAQRWLSVLDRTDVEHHWISGIHVDWKTGEPDGELEKNPEHATHCSLFVSALAEQLNVPLLRPPEHPAHQLANAQFDWLVATGPSQGWVPVATPLEAQQRANRGEWVLAVYRAQKATSHGHIAVVRPAIKTAAELERDGPQITQAGAQNFKSASLAKGFEHHPLAWSKARDVRFFAHPLAPP